MEHLSRPQGEVREALLVSQEPANGDIRVPRLTPQACSRPGRQHGQGLPVAEAPEDGPQEQVREAVAEIPREIPLGTPGPLGPVPLPGRPVVEEPEAVDAPRLPTVELGLDLVDRVPAESLFQRHHIVQAGKAVGTHGTSYVRACVQHRPPRPVFELPAGAACDSQVGIGRELGGQLFEMVGIERTSASTLTTMS